MSGQPELVCARCQPTEAENAQLRQALLSMQQENTDLASELAGARATLRTIERQKAALQAELTKAREDNPRVKEIMGFQEFWKVTTGATTARISSKGKRFKDVEQAFLIANADELREAVRGALLKPWVSFGRRYVTRPTEDRKVYEKAEIKLSLYDIVGSDDKIETHRKIFREAQAAADTHPDIVVELWRRAAAQEAEYFGLVMKIAAAKDRDLQPSEETLKAITNADHVLELLDEKSNVVPIRSEAA